jgi:hypothetical protein
MESPLLGIVLDSSVIIAAERKGQTVEELLTLIGQTFGEVEIVISAVKPVALVSGSGALLPVVLHQISR